jgi:hypothetical protein
MAERPVFIVNVTGSNLVAAKFVEFQWFAGMSVKQKQRSVESLHGAAENFANAKSILEISTKSPEELGVRLSAFNLSFTTVKQNRTLTVECAYQGSKVFKDGGPYIDIFEGTSRDAKRDERLISSGEIIGFRFFGNDWSLEPKTAFYDWLYISALRKNYDLSEKILNYSAFTDIEFNPQKSLNCQAYSAALFVSMTKRGIIAEVMRSPESFRDFSAQIPKGNHLISDKKQKALDI